MSGRRVTSSVLAWAVVWASCLHAAEPTFVAEDDYFVVRAATPLQQVLLGWEDSEVPAIYAEIDVSSLAKSPDGLMRLRRTLERFAATEAANGGYITIHPVFRSSTSTDGIVLFYDLVEGMARHVGFENVMILGTTDLDRDWEPLSDPAQEKEPASEENIGNDLVKVYPVRTGLSRRRTEDIICLISIDAPRIESWTDELQSVLVTAAQRAMIGNGRSVSISVDDPSGKFSFPADKVAKALQECGYGTITLYECSPDGCSTATYSSDDEMTINAPDPFDG